MARRLINDSCATRQSGNQFLNWLSERRNSFRNCVRIHSNSGTLATPHRIPAIQALVARAAAHDGSTRRRRKRGASACISRRPSFGGGFCGAPELGDRGGGFGEFAGDLLADGRVGKALGAALVAGLEILLEGNGRGGF